MEKYIGTKDVGLWFDGNHENTWFPKALLNNPRIEWRQNSKMPGKLWPYHKGQALLYDEDAG